MQRFKNFVTGPRRTELQFARVLTGSRQLWPNIEHYLIICTNAFLHQVKRSASQTAAKIVDTDHKDNSDKRDLYSDKNDNARISEMKMRISLFPLLTVKNEEEEEAMCGSDSEIADNDMELQHSEISNIANF